MPVTSSYDPMLAKVIAWGPDRTAALRLLDAALADTAVLGVTTNTAFLRNLLRDPDVRAGRLDTGLVGHLIDAGAGQEPVPDDVVAAAALCRLLSVERSGAERSGAVRSGAEHPGGGCSGPGHAGTWAGPWDIPDGWRIGEPAWTRFRFRVAGTDAEARVSGLVSRAAQVAVGDGDPVAARAGLDDAGLLVTYAGRTVRFACATDAGTLWLGRDGHAWALTEETTAPVRQGQGVGADATVRSPMPGTVITVHVSAGQAVTAGQPLLVVEAMKMEHTVTAPADGVVAELTVKSGQQVAMDETLAVIGPQPGDDG
jgi:acetyl-CoA/propionyl-CoA carboxylase biotin carboxyl carrier protein